MPRAVQDILDHADELARRFEAYELAAEDERDAEVSRPFALECGVDRHRAIPNMRTMV